MATDTSKPTDEDRIRSTVLRQAKDIKDRKKLQARIADLVIEAFDLPSKPDADPAKPQSSDASLFRHCLSLFQASDLDDLIYERNIDHRCGYALCPRPNRKLAQAGEKVWNQKGGKDFKLVDRIELEKWCSKTCQDRTDFVRAQLGTEPAWLRVIRAVDIKLLDEVGSGDLNDSFKVCTIKSCHVSRQIAHQSQTLSISKATDDDMVDRMQALALERGELNVNTDDGSFDLIERSSDKIPRAPILKGKQQAGAIEGHQPRKVRFSGK